MTPVQAVLFDAADTLFTNAVLSRRVAELDGGSHDGLSAGSLGRGISAVGKRGLWPEDSATRSERLRRWAEFYRLALAEAGLPAGPASRLARELGEIVVDPASYTRFADVEPILAVIASRGLRTGIVSNFDPLLSPILEHTGLAHRFPVVVTSWEIGVYKPDPKIFQAALDRLNVAAPDAIFVGDSPYSDVGGARAAGMRPVLLDRTALVADPGTTVIAGLGELAGLLK